MKIRRGDYVVPLPDQVGNKNVVGRNYPAKVLGTLWGGENLLFEQENIAGSREAKASRFCLAVPNTPLEDFL